MGFAGLNIDHLKRALARIRIEAEVIEDDSFGDHCVMRLVDMRYPHAEAMLCYENMGIEPRYVRFRRGILQADEGKSLGGMLRSLADGQTDTLQLVGRQSDDVRRIVDWVAIKYRSTSGRTTTS
jgi:hypothetical protein